MSKSLDKARDVATAELQKLSSLEDMNLAIAALLAIKENPTRFKQRMGPFVLENP